jgi:carbonic anhydrase/acetyltransferase-like protein (isoleucine patch superfamily)
VTADVDRNVQVRIRCGVSVGHNAVLHGEDGFLIGMGAARLLLGSLRGPRRRR